MTAPPEKAEQYEKEFSKEHDYAKVRGEDNIFKYFPLKKVALRVSAHDGLFDTLARIMAAKIAHSSLHVSIDISVENSVISFLFENKHHLFEANDTVVREDEETFSGVIAKSDKVFFNTKEAVSSFIYEKAALQAKCIVTTPPLMEGRIEMLHYFGEQSISHSYHRYGNLGKRGLKS